MSSVLLVPDLPLERWAAMDKYAHRLHDWLESSDFGFQVRLAAHIGALTRDSVGRGTINGPNQTSAGASARHQVEACQRRPGISRGAIRYRRKPGEFFRCPAVE